METNQAWMRRALELAGRGRATVSPNPMVGCVLVSDGAVVGEGFHERAGGPHAEIAALAEAGARAAGATAYVTLEPCTHHGRTPPCVDALVEAGVACVVAAIGDPHPQAGGGLAALRRAGVETALGVCAEEARAQNEVFLHGLATGRPFVQLKAATSLDGRVAAADGSSQWLTGAETRGLAHDLRAEVDAVVVGSGTVLADDPRLTCRLADGAPAAAQPLRVVLDARARVGQEQRVVADGAAPTLVLVGEDAPPERCAMLRSAGAEVAGVPRAAGGVGLALVDVLDALWARQVRNILVEGGSALLGSLLRAGLWDRLHLHLAPVLLGETARPLASGFAVPTLSEAPRLQVEAVREVDADVVLTLRPEKQSKGA